MSLGSAEGSRRSIAGELKAYRALRNDELSVIW
jgi:hypothetical protein